MRVHRLSNVTQWQKKLAKPGGASLVNRKYLYGKKLSTFKIKWGCSSLAPPFTQPVITHIHLQDVVLECNKAKLCNVINQLHKLCVN